MSNEIPEISGDLNAAKQSADTKGSRVHELVHSDTRRVIVEVVHGPGWRAFFLAILAVAVLALGVGVNTLLSSQREAPARRAHTPKPKVVDTLPVKMTEYEVVVSAMASAKPVRSLSIVSQVSGRVISAHPELRSGGFIRQGETLFSLDDTDLQNTVERLNAQIAQAKARKRSLQARLKGAKKSTKNARQALKLSTNQLSREETLRKQGHTTEAALDQTKLTVNTQQERLETAQTNRAVLPGQIAQVTAEIAAANTLIEQAKLDLTRTTMVAEFDSQVRQGALEPGAWVQAGAALARLESTGNLEFTLSISIDDVLWLIRDDSPSPQSREQWVKQLIGRKVEVKRPNSKYSKGHTWSGEIRRVGPGLDERTRMISLIVQVDQPITSNTSLYPAVPLLPDMFCRLTIPGRTLRNVVVLPRKSIQTEGEVYLAVLADDKLTLKRQAVEIALVQGDLAIITAGLSRGDKVITTALPKAMSGMALTLRTPPSKPGVASR